MPTLGFQLQWYRGSSYLDHASQMVLIDVPPFPGLGVLPAHRDLEEYAAGYNLEYLVRRTMVVSLE